MGQIKLKRGLWLHLTEFEFCKQAGMQYKDQQLINAVKRNLVTMPENTHLESTCILF